MQKIYKHVQSVFLLILLCLFAVGTYNTGPDKIDAFVMSQQFVKERLKSPSTASFPWYDDSFVKDLGDRRYCVTSYVDAQNSFGAKIRSNYFCVLQNIDGDNWTLESININ